MFFIFPYKRHGQQPARSNQKHPHSANIKRQKNSLPPECLTFRVSTNFCLALSLRLVIKLLWKSYLFDGLLGCFRRGERDESVAAIQIGQRVHHETEVPDGSALFEQGDELVFVNVARDFATKDLRTKKEGERSVSAKQSTGRCITMG